MASTAARPRLLDELRRIFVDRGAGADAPLLRAFVAERDESAFAQLVRRHGPMVLGVCRRIVGNDHDA